MRILKYWARSANILNLLLLGFLIVGGVFALYPRLWVETPQAVTVSRATAGASDETTPPNRVPSPLDFAIVNEQNLFHPERRIPPEKKAEKEMPRPELVLYGTLLDSDGSVAFIEDKKAPYATPGRGKRQRVVKKGDNISGFVLREIHEKQIVLARGDEVITVYLDNEAKVRGEDSIRAADGRPTVPAAARTAGVPATNRPASTAAPVATTQPPAPSVAATGQSTDGNVPQITRRIWVPGQRRFIGIPNE